MYNLTGGKEEKYVQAVKYIPDTINIDGETIPYQEFIARTANDKEEKDEYYDVTKC